MGDLLPNGPFEGGALDTLRWVRCGLIGVHRQIGRRRWGDNARSAGHEPSRHCPTARKTNPWRNVSWPQAAASDDHLAAGEPCHRRSGRPERRPGLDQYERLFGRCGVEIAHAGGAAARPRLYDPHPRAVAATAGSSAQPPTRASTSCSDGARCSAPLDYVMVSPALMPAARRWSIGGTPYRRRGLLVGCPIAPIALLDASVSLPGHAGSGRLCVKGLCDGRRSPIFSGSLRRTPDHPGSRSCLRPLRSPRRTNRRHRSGLTSCGRGSRMILEGLMDDMRPYDRRPAPLPSSKEEYAAPFRIARQP